MIYGEYLRNSSAQSDSEKIIELSTQGTLTQLIPAESCAHWRDDTTTLVQHTLHNKTNNELQVLHDSDSKLVLVAWARIDNRDELAKVLGIDSNKSTESDNWFILKSYQRWGEDCVDHLVGDFVFVIYDGPEQKLFCARDHMGVRPFFYHLSPDRFVFATHLSFFHFLDCCELEPSSEWIAEFLSGLSMSFDKTAYPTVLKLPPAHCLTVTRNNHSLRQYFQFSENKKLELDDSSKYVDVYREQLEEAIKCRIDKDGMVGTELSGGIDSSTITAYAAKFMDRPAQKLHAFAFANCELEPEYVHAVSQTTKLAATHVFTHLENDPEQRREIMAKALSISGYPEEHGNGTGHEPFYQMAEKFNIRSLLSGFGGDEFVTASAGLVLKELYREGRYIELYNAVKGNALTRLLRVIKTIVNDKRTQKGRFHTAFGQRWQHQLLKPEWVEEYDLQARIKKKALFDESYNSLNEFTLQNRWAPFVPTRMENCTLMAAAKGIEYRWPLLDVRLIKLFLSIPSIEKHNHGKSRLLHRRAIDPIVPHKVTWKPQKDMGSNAGANEVFGDTQALLKVEDLHPRLTDLIDTQKLSQQLAEVGTLKKAGMSNHLFQVNKNINNLLWLNQWLHQFH